MIDDYDVPHHWSIFQRLSDRINYPSIYDVSYVIEAFDAAYQLRSLAMLAQRGELTMNQLANDFKSIRNHLDRILNCDYPRIFQRMEFSQFPCDKFYIGRQQLDVKTKKSRKESKK